MAKCDLSTKDIKTRILTEMEINLDVNEKIGEQTIFFTGIFISRNKKNRLSPTYITIMDDKSADKNKKDYGDHTRLIKAQEEYMKAISEKLELK